MADNVEPFLTPKFRAAFVWAFKAKPDKPRPGETPKKPRYTVLMLFPKGTDLSVLKKGFQDACKLKWDSKAEATAKLPQFKTPFKDALAVCNTEGEPYFPWAEGWTAIEAWSYTQPGIAGPKLDPTTGKVEILTVEEDFYSGCWSRAKVRPYAYDGRKDQKGFGANFDLINLQKMADDEKFGGGGRTKAEDDFEAIEAAPADDDWNS
jgi:hypothetical protein